MGAPQPTAQKRRSPAPRRGFSLLEVMVAIGILGLAATVILSAQGGLVSQNRSAADMGTAIHLGRCKMSELEEKLLKLGYSELDEIESEAVCCDDKPVARFLCNTKIEKIILPLPPQATLGADGGFLSLGGSLDGGLPSNIPAGIPSALGTALNPGAPLDLDAGLQNIGAMMGQQAVPGGGGGMGALGLLSTVFSIVYPSLKPLLEFSIRKISVTVKWTEGLNTKEWTLTQYVVNPARAGFLSGAGDGGVIFEGGAAPVATGGGSPGGGALTGAPTPTPTSMGRQ